MTVGAYAVQEGGEGVPARVGGDSAKGGKPQGGSGKGEGKKGEQRAKAAARKKEPTGEGKDRGREKKRAARRGSGRHLRCPPRSTPSSFSRASPLSRRAARLARARCSSASRAPSRKRSASSPA